MPRYIVSRLAATVVMALLATLVIFLIANMVPGDPILAQLGDVAASNKAFVAEWRAKWGLDLPLWERYLIFLKGVVHGDLGISIASQRPVLEDIAQYAPATIELATVRLPHLARGRRAARHARRHQTRQLDRSSGPRHIAHRGFLADLLARLHHAGALLRRVADRAGTRDGSTRSPFHHRR